MAAFNDLVGIINNYYYNILVFMLIAVGFYYSYITKFVQFRMFKDVLDVLKEKQDDKNKHHISPFQALMVSTASRVGIGNIAGISFAITAGGAGSLFWMWLMAFFGGAAAFAESTLAQVYKSKDGQSFKGGPAYYIKKALHSPFFGGLFALILILTYAYGFNSLQAQTLTSAYKVYYEAFANSSQSFASSSWPLIIGALLAAFGAFMFFGHHTKIAKISALIVPIMAFIYIILAFIAFLLNITQLPLVCKLIFHSAFDFDAIFGGLAGSALVIGIKRGLFSNEAGMGSAPNAAAAANTSHPAKQGIVQSFSVLLDVLICSSTGFLILFSQTYLSNKGVDGKPLLTALPLVQAAMGEYYGKFGLHFTTLAVTLFAITSLIGNFYYAQANVKYLTKSKLIFRLFQASSVLIIFMGANMSLDLAWNLADVTMAMMASVNIVAIFLLGKVVVKVLDDYNYQKSQGKDPSFNATKVGIKNTQCWD